ncbi:Zinc uptake regulation protein [Vibrio stylophorae]|uniref:Ferric uptake regulation protein n=1 Tax=Vibrio stylophorae TaxID=659351 RepID=A0ABN8DMT4_9VIBR|nr:zinc uptake transcriptional repressor Zur [Vibrio stylophorae]CAH0532411.1 Zinc uptake regulation protein [Vibrio stylophorae]
MLVEQQMEQAKAICDQRGVRMTPQRMMVFALLLRQRKAQSAYDLLDALKLEMPHAKPPTVYRALDFLLEQGFIHKVESTNSFIACGHLGSAQHCSVLLICERCDAVVETHHHQIEHALNEQAQQHGFQVLQHVIETHGVCPQCQS